MAMLCMPCTDPLRPIRVGIFHLINFVLYFIVNFAFSSNCLDRMNRCSILLKFFFVLEYVISHFLTILANDEGNCTI